EAFYGLPAADAVGATLSDVFDAQFVNGLRAAQGEHPYGATLSRVPLTARGPHAAPSADGDAASRLLINATAIPLQTPAEQGSVVAGTILLIENITDRVRLEE